MHKYKFTFFSTEKIKEIKEKICSDLFILDPKHHYISSFKILPENNLLE